ncbi:pyridoxamine 5'-phosphate oxidase family protein [Thalassospira sp. ER-Se-21-Dark]|uniref:pyridoxamine 5'-phosphate oxidase family protein n=1 Tax=Thalassospira sp. ER-Se-21-Dark TaxID=2585190 RepID=UPI001B30F7F8|nr:pyridoxamine 5'-phosphate oxidase family protein [Thalassospira sp. ER-Se-21-Dark]MBP3124461.1 flavin-nucleotide-binding protein [Thalassospira sp. ER-Se-21-Dark]
MSDHSDTTTHRTAPQKTPGRTPSPWHAGEVRLQEILGVDARMEEVGRKVLRDHIIEQHRLFYPQLPFAVLGTVDGDGNPWATLRANRPGFLFASDPTHLSVSLPRDKSDPADAGMNDGDAIGLLGIELHTRRRNRLNGTISRRNETYFDIKVGHSFGNCPKYIHPRNLEFATDVKSPIQSGTALTDDIRDFIARSDTFFIASYVDNAAPDRGREVDVSHRGGPPGFVTLDDQDTLIIPDYAGNRFFNTLGNLLINPLTGLVFVDFTNGNMLQITGTAEIIMGGAMVTQFVGAERLLNITPSRWVLRRGAFPMRMAGVAEG